MAGETPTPSFAPEAQKGRPGLVEKIPVVRTLAEKVKARNEKIADRAARPRVTGDQLDAIRADRRANQKPALNLTEDPRFQQMVSDERARVLAAKSGILTELGGQAPPPTPSEIAKAQSAAYERFRQAHEDSAEQYAADGFHFSKNSDNTFSIDPGADPFYRSFKRQAEEARLQGGDNAAREVMDRFTAKYPAKADVYARHGEQALKDSLARGASTPDAVPATAGQTRSVEAAHAPTRENIRAPEQLTQLQKDILTMKELSGTPKTDMSFKKRNDLIKLEKALAVPLQRARQLAAKLDASEFLSDEELADLVPFEELLKEENKAKTKDGNRETEQAAPTEGALAASEAQRRALGSEAIGKLKARGIDISTVTEAQVLQALKNHQIGDWKDIGETQQYIHEAFEEQKRLQVEAVVARIPTEMIEQLDKNGIKTKAILELLLALLATGVITLGKDTIQTATK